MLTNANHRQGIGPAMHEEAETMTGETDRPTNDGWSKGGRERCVALHPWDSRATVAIDRRDAEIARLNAALDTACQDAARVYCERDRYRRALVDLEAFYRAEDNEIDCGYAVADRIRAARAAAEGE